VDSIKGSEASIESPPKLERLELNSGGENKGSICEATPDNLKSYVLKSTGAQNDEYKQAEVIMKHNQPFLNTCPINVQEVLGL